LKHEAFRWRRRYRRAIQLIGSHFYVNPDRDMRRSILVAGTGRSGTTWLADLIGSQIPCRILFEPFHSVYVPGYHDFHYFQYMRVGTENRGFYNFACDVFTGNIHNRWVDHQNEKIFPEYRLIKEIRANLSLKWLHDNFPEVPILFIIRHPCAVVQSRMEWGWAADTDIESFLTQPDLVSDYLADYLDLIRKSSNEEEKHAIIWSVSNLVPIKQFRPGELKIVHYENLSTRPEAELQRIFEIIGQRYEHPVIKRGSRPSMTTRSTSAIVTGNNQLARWRKSLSSVQIERIWHVVKAFRLVHLYGDSWLPLSTVND
jgi:hypothetical protein